MYSYSYIFVLKHSKLDLCIFQIAENMFTNKNCETSMNET